MKNSLLDKTFWGMFARFTAVVIVTMAVITVIGFMDSKSKEVRSSAIEAVE